MAVHGESISLGAEDTCPDCGLVLEIEVQSSAAGFYLGAACNCGPYSRESGYYATREAALHDLAEDTWIRRDADFVPSGLTWETLDLDDVAFPPNLNTFCISIEGIKAGNALDCHLAAAFKVTEERALAIYEMLVNEYMEQREGDTLSNG